MLGVVACARMWSVYTGVFPIRASVSTYALCTVLVLPLMDDEAVQQHHAKVSIRRELCLLLRCFCVLCRFYSIMFALPSLTCAVAVVRWFLGREKSRRLVFPPVYRSCIVAVVALWAQVGATPGLEWFVLRLSASTHAAIACACRRRFDCQSPVLAPS